VARRALALRPPRPDGVRTGVQRRGAAQRRACADTGARLTLTLPRRDPSAQTMHASAPRESAHRCVQQLIKVLVVAEDDVAAHVEEEALGREVRARQAAGLIRLVSARGG
jgi:hypothetical protein